MTELGSRSASSTRAISTLFNPVPACHCPEKSKCLIGKYVGAKRCAGAMAPVRILPPSTLSPWMNGLVCSGCHNRIPQTRALNQHKLFPQHSEAVEVQGQDAIGVGFWGSLSSWLVGSCMWREREKSLKPLPPLRGTPVLILFNLSYLPKTSSHCGLGLPRMGFGGMLFSVK